MTKLLSVLLTTLAISLYGQVPTNGLVSSYPFTGNSNDASGNGNNLTPFNGPTPTTDRFGNPNCAYFFDGINDYFTAPNPGPLFKKSRSIAFWAKMSANFNSQGYTVLNYGDPNGSGARFEIGLNSGCNGLYVDIGNGYGTATYSNTIDNTWHFYAIVHDSTISTQLPSVKFYVDAILTNSFCVQPWVQTVNTVNNLPINIGRFNSSLPRYFNGSLDDIHVYNRPLTQAEITGMFNPCSAAPSAPTSISGNQNVCNGISNLYSASTVLSATSYSWIVPAGWNGSSNSSSATFTPGINSGVISVAAINGCGTSSFVSINVTSNTTPTVTAITANYVICKGNATSIQASGANTYSWSNGSTTSSISVSPTITTQYTVTGFNSNGCFSKVVKTVSVTNNPLPTISATGPGTSCAGQSVNLASNGATTYTWQPGNLTGFFVTVNPTITTSYTVTGTDNNGCYNNIVYTQTVNVCTGMSANVNTLSEVKLYPNPTKDYFTLTGINNAQIEVYNAYGAMIYNTIQSGKDFHIDISANDNGVYFVKISTPGKVIVKKIVKE